MYAAVNLKQNLRSIYCTIEANNRHEASRGLFATAELLCQFLYVYAQHAIPSSQRSTGDIDVTQQWGYKGQKLRVCGINASKKPNNQKLSYYHLNTKRNVINHNKRSK